MSGAITNKFRFCSLGRGCVVLPLFFLSLTGLLAACGKKGDPFLPLQPAPEKVRQLRAVARPETVVLVWKAPRKNTNDTDLLDLAGFRIFREAVPFGKECRTCPHNFTAIEEIAYSGPRNKVPGRELMPFFDRAVEPETIYTYRVQAYNAQGVTGPYSNTVSVYFDLPFRPPSNVRVQRTDMSLILIWEPPRQLADKTPAEPPAGYTVYRSTAPGATGQLPINREPVTSARYEDLPPELDVTYYYTVRALRTVGGSYIESDPSQEVRYAFADETPAPVPAMLTAVPMPDGVLLKWAPPFERDWAGFYIYRRAPDEQEFVRLNETPVSETSWTDTTARQGSGYVYAVTSVDTSARANESDLSQPAEVMYILE